MSFSDDIERPEGEDTLHEWNRLKSEVEQEAMKQAKVILMGPLAKRPPPGSVGRVFVADEDETVYWDFGAGWISVGEWQEPLRWPPRGQ